MKPFHFSLQTVLDYRDDLEESKALNYQQIQQKVQASKKEQERLNQELNELAEYLETGDGLNFVKIQQGYRYQVQLGEELFLEEQRLYNLKKQLQRAYQEWMQSRQEVQVMEKLKEKHQEIHQQEVDRAESMQLEEYSTLLRPR